MDGIDKHATFYRAYLPADRSLVPMTIALATIVALWFFVYLVSPSVRRPRRRPCAPEPVSPRSLCTRRAADGAGQTQAAGPRKSPARAPGRDATYMRGRRAGGLFNLRRRLCLASTGGGGKRGRSDLGFLGCGALSHRTTVGSGCIILDSFGFFVQIVTFQRVARREAGDNFTSV